MAKLARVTVNWSGFVGAPGYTNLYFRNSTPGVISQTVVDNAVTKVDAFLAAVRPSLASTTTTVVDETIEEIEETTGELQAFWAASTAAAGVGTSTGAYSAAAGACVAWSTNGIRNGRRIRGRTFLVPIGGNALAADGSIDATELTAIRTAADNLRATTGDSRLVIWARPTAPGATDGGSAEVVSSNVVDKTAVLRSRRD